MDFLEYIKNIFINFKWQYALEIALITVVFWSFWTFFKHRNAVWLAYIGFVVFVLVFVGGLLGFVGTKIYVLILSMLCVVLPVVLFAGDIKRGLFRISWKNFDSVKHQSNILSHEELAVTSENIIKACQNMSKNDIGALIVIADKPSDAILESGTVMRSMLTSELLETIFFPKSPLHDGAVIVTGDVIVAAGCYLPLSTRTDLPKEFGTRHRAAVGLSETDPSATVIVVSEESGIISAMHDGMTLRYLDGDTLGKVLSHALNIDGMGSEESTVWGTHHE